MDHFTDRLLRECDRKGAPICVGIDPIYQRLPGELKRTDVMATGAQQRVDAITDFVQAVLSVVAPHVPCVKFQSACFERYRWPGVEAYYRLIQTAHDLGLIVIGDAKRGDIGISSEHYAAGCLADDSFCDLGNLRGPDAITINPYLGADGMDPFIQQARVQGKGVFALVRTSNPGGDAIQNMALKDGRCVADAVAKVVAEIGAESDLIGQRHYSLLGAVVGATKAADAARLRQIMPQQFFLVPGFGAQGGGAEDVRACLKSDGTGAIISASRSVLYAYENTHGDWRSAVEQAVLTMKTQINAIVQATGSY